MSYYITVSVTNASGDSLEEDEYEFDSLRSLSTAYEDLSNLLKESS